ncbi:hypothetical protein [Lunatibacter salilacus]|uniref:hypothetical protein n=1 Tax=Lunatibacter salilacus TaxID=2483804 RepID=UPI00131DE776|nr:hypothetical protein [Lunatibacter salilacus]
MKRIQLFLLAITYLISCSSPAPLDKQSLDWLIDGSRYTSAVDMSEDGKELVMSNGLLERRFRISPNFATVGLNNLVTGETYLRSVRPEAKITLDGEEFPIGGLVGQPIQNYLLEEWKDGLLNDEEAFQFATYEIKDIRPRMAWKKRPEWMPADAVWPPKGKELAITFTSPIAVGKSSSRTSVYSDEFSKLESGWEIYASESNPRNSFFNEGKPGEIMADEQASVFAERPFPQDAKGVIGRINPGTDKSTSWGAGLVFVFSDKNIKINLRPGKGTVGFWDGKSEQELGEIDEGRSYYLKLELTESKVVGSISEDGTNWNDLAEVQVSGRPNAVRVGKSDRSGGNSDGIELGNTERGKVEYVEFFGESHQQSGMERGSGSSQVTVHYELYDGLPLMSKWITYTNKSDKPVRVDKFVSEVLAVVEGESSVEGEERWELPNIHVETDFAFGSMGNRESNKSTVHWKKDPSFTSQVNYALETPALLEVHPSYGPAQEVAPGSTFESFRTWELFFDSFDKERKGLSIRKMYRTVSPWVTENPILMHVRKADPESVKLAIDQSAEVGFEMAIMTFGSGFDMETGDTAYYRKMEELAKYAHEKGIALGGYSLLASRSISEEHDIINPATGKPGGIAKYGNSPCLASEWGIEYFRRIREMYEATGLDIIEHDGNYPGDICASHDHPGHKGLEDSQWNQHRIISDLYAWCRSKGIYLNVPDWYFMNGSSKIAMGYREVNWSLPRAQQEIIERQNIYDGTWTKTPSMGWMFVPLTEYQGGGAAATIEPLEEHLAHYSQRMANLFGAGVQACYRGPRLYDTDSTKRMVEQWVSFYKTHREILDSDIIHLRRPDGRDWDGLLHVNPKGEEKGFLMLYNPLEKSITRNITVPVYYTGLGKKLMLTTSDGKNHNLTISRDYTVELEVTIPAKSHTYAILTN